MPRFKAYNYDQNAMVVINYQDQLQPGTFEHAVNYLIEHKLDLSVFHKQIRQVPSERCQSIGIFYYREQTLTQLHWLDEAPSR
ncbi:transposase [Halomonas sp. TD01]|uniref:transposase n=1 Tax=Halomonas sp. TD01 TaxID=999141 RepID=UPI00031DFEFC|nr:transposase [Halomonas sp. TD01]CAH1041710.1 Transposase [Halomonas sp. TD01]